MNDNDITLFEACEILSVSKKTISRYIRHGKLNPQRIRSQQGTLEYRFRRAELEALRGENTAVEGPSDQTGQSGQTRQDTQEPIKQPFVYKSGQGRQDISEQTGQGRQDNLRADETGTESLIDLLRETTELLKVQLTVKDGQITTLNGQIQELIQRDRETNILLKGMQDRLLFLAPPAGTAETQAGAKPMKPVKPGRRIFPVILLILLLLTTGLYFYLKV